MNFQMMRVISSPSISTTGFFTLILAMAGGLYHAGAVRAHGSDDGRGTTRTRAQVRASRRADAAARVQPPASSIGRPAPHRRPAHRRSTRVELAAGHLLDPLHDLVGADVDAAVAARRLRRSPGRATRRRSAPARRRRDVDRAARVAEARVDAVAAGDELAVRARSSAAHAGSVRARRRRRPASFA